MVAITVVTVIVLAAVSFIMLTAKMEQKPPDPRNKEILEMRRAMIECLKEMIDEGLWELAKSIAEKSSLPELFQDSLRERGMMICPFCGNCIVPIWKVACASCSINLNQRSTDETQLHSKDTQSPEGRRRGGHICSRPEEKDKAGTEANIECHIPYETRKGHSDNLRQKHKGLHPA